MALIADSLDDGPKTLEEALGHQAQTASMTIGNQYAKKRRQATSQAAKAGRLGSGVQNYTFDEINANELDDLGGVQDALAQALGRIPADDYAATQEAGRSAELSRLIAKLSQPSDLEKILGLTGQAAGLAGTAAGFF